MNVFFDMDDTLVSSWDGGLRPHVHDVFTRVLGAGHVIYVWSGVGIRWYEVDKHDLRQYVSDCFLKPLWDYRRRLAHLGVKAEPHFVVDDYPEVVEPFGGYAVKPYSRRDPNDVEMLRIYEAIRTYDVESRPFFDASRVVLEHERGRAEGGDPEPGGG